MKMRADTGKASAGTRRWFVWIVISWLSMAVLGAMLLFRMVMPDLPPGLSLEEANNPVFDAVLARDVRALIEISDELEPQWLDEAHNGMTPIMQASSHGDVEMVESLLRAGAGPHKRGAAQRTALQYAAEKNRIQVAVVLLDAGVDIEGADVSGLTPLLDAARRGNVPLAQELLRRGADVNVLINGNSAVRLAEDNGHPELAKLLRAAGGRR